MLLARRGYVLVGFENVLRLPLPARPVPAAPSVEVTVSGPDEFARWIDVIVTGFASPDTQGVSSHEEFPRDVLASVVTDLAASPCRRLYLAR